MLLSILDGEEEEEQPRRSINIIYYYIAIALLIIGKRDNIERNITAIYLLLLNI